MSIFANDGMVYYIHGQNVQFHMEHNIMRYGAYIILQTQILRDVLKRKHGLSSVDNASSMHL